MRRLTVALLTVGLLASGQDDGPRIVSPPDRAHFLTGNIDIVAKAPEGAKLTLDARAVKALRPFPGVLHGATILPEGEHQLTLTWADGSETIGFFVGDSAPEGYAEFTRHPPNSMLQCARCHGLSRRGRFRFGGGCFNCHPSDGFETVHSHEPHVLESCGLCHDAHGSTSPKHLTMSKELACKQCHN